MMPDWQAVWRAILEPDEDARQSCCSYRDLLYAIVDAELEGKDAAHLFPAAYEHLQACAACREECEDLRAVLTGEQRGELTEPPIKPVFDLSYLRPAAGSDERLWARDPRGSLWLDLAMAFFGGRRQQLALATRSAGKSPPAGPQEVLYQWSIGTEETGDLDVDVIALRDENEPALCTLVVRAEAAERWPDLAGTEVIARWREETARAVTDQDGRVTFRRVPVDALMEAVLQITPPMQG